MRVLIAGSSGLIGSALVAHLRAAGHDVLRLVRREPAGPDERSWDPPAARIDEGTFDGVDAVVNLCGVGIADRPWSGARRQQLRDSRTVPTEVLAAAVADHGVAAFLSGSAVGIYGDAGPQEVDERAPSGGGFLAELCRDWEGSARKAQEAGARVVLLRSGLVLSRRGGLLGRLRPLFKGFLGARLGRGTQYMPWISLDDHIGAIRFLLEHPEVSGPVNLTGPLPVTNTEFTAALAAAVKRPAGLAVPAFVLKATMGVMGEEMLLYSQRAVPAALQDAGFPFRHVTVGEALSAVVDR
ncbi:TIGR01777 family oxidoreductase [Pseudonocardia sp. GCM10023141]|uniref:TIGR01777 family oxidoreductase n=1 Tax=Pseudonocardia sp. GCM10023141 TaxID=3252653 RepID=UPI00360DBED5